MSSIICLCNRVKNTTLLRKVNNALNKGGHLWINDMKIDDSKTKPVESAIFAINMLVNTPSGCLYSDSEVRGFLYKTGFSNIETIPVHEYLCLIAQK